MSRRFLCVALLWLSLSMVLCVGAIAAPPHFTVTDRWFFCSTNLLVDENVDKLAALFERASKVGYNGVLLADSKFSHLADVDARYYRNAARVKQLAATWHLEIVPAIFPIGYSNDLLYQDPNLAEGVPVRNALYVVHHGEARLVADPPVALRDGDFAGTTEKWDWQDPTVTVENGMASIIDPKGHNARIVQSVEVSPFRQYHISVRVKTDHFQGTPQVAILADGQPLCYQGLGAKASQDWTECHATFNSLNHRKVLIYLGCWDGGTGSLYWKDARIEEVGFLNLLRREGAPLMVTREDTGAMLQEGKDYQPVADPRMGVIPWPGGYEVWHEPPALNTALPEGTRLRVSFYHAVVLSDGQVTICPSEPKTIVLLRDQMRRMQQLWGAKSYLMSHDEIRVLNWDASCSQRNLDAGEILADNVKTCIQIIREVNPKARIFVWSDMFDPHHNAHADYYMVRGDLAGSWKGLDKDVYIAMWNFGNRDKSLQFFSQLGNRQLIAGYYDSAPENIHAWLDSANKVTGVTGVMYTTWENKYDDLERFEHDVYDYLVHN